jgi:hypothetical protein
MYTFKPFTETFKQSARSALGDTPGPLFVFVKKKLTKGSAIIGKLSILIQNT